MKLKKLIVTFLMFAIPTLVFANDYVNIIGTLISCKTNTERVNFKIVQAFEFSPSLKSQVEIRVNDLIIHGSEENRLGIASPLQTDRFIFFEGNAVSDQIFGDFGNAELTHYETTEIVTNNGFVKADQKHHVNAFFSRTSSSRIIETVSFTFNWGEESYLAEQNVYEATGSFFNVAELIKSSPSQEHNYELKKVYQSSEEMSCHIFDSFLQVELFDEQKVLEVQKKEMDFAAYFDELDKIAEQF